MDLFRRIFGKPDEEAQKPTAAPTSAEQAAKPAKPTLDEKDTLEVEKPAEFSQPEASAELDPIDPTTYPVSVHAPSKMKPVSPADGVTQPLNQDAVSSMSKKKKSEFLAFGQATDVGLVRSNNQDSALSFLFTSKSSEDHPGFGLFIVADGMGGHHDGEKASAIATRVMASNITNTIYLPMLTNENDVDRPPITEALISAVQKANHEVIRLVPEGGTTVTAVAVVGDLAYFAHVGDSRAYLMSEEGIEQITRDHSLVQRLIELEQLTQEEAAHHNQKNVLYRAIGQNESLEVDAMTRRLSTNMRILICSDGLWGSVEERELYEIAMNTPDPQVAADKLVALANTRGGMDNITAILLKVV
ncbi:MAG: protein phosphatase 2C domain-containing protein [Anaerolineae bacterium]